MLDVHKLPKEIKLTILTFIPPKFFVNFFLINKEWLSISKINYFWKVVCFNEKNILNEVDLYKKLFKFDLKNEKVDFFKLFKNFRKSVNGFKKHIDKKTLIGQFDIKFVIIGNHGVGKSSFHRRYVQNKFENSNFTIGVDFGLVKLSEMFVDISKNDRTNFKLQLWDTASEEKFRSVPSYAIRGTDGIILCFDLTNTQSFIDIERVFWNSLDDQKALDKLMIVLVGCKCDLINERKIKYDDAYNWALRRGILYFETSSKDDINVGLTVHSLIRKLWMKKGFVVEKTKKFQQKKKQKYVLKNDVDTNNDNSICTLL